MKELRIAKSLTLPLAYVTHRNAVLAMSGAGKSNLCVVLAEEMFRTGIPWIAIDPKGDWWGVRAAANGDGRGLDVPIIGGEHGDLPLSPRSGARMAELVAGGKLQGVFDVSGFDSDELSEFLIDFGTVLLRSLRTPLHVFCEECSDYLPQPGSSGRLDKLAADCLKVWKKLSTQGRFRGLGYTLISQRAAMVNKSALYQCETLIAMRVVGEHDKKTVQRWIEQQADAREIMKTLPLLEDGEAWVCSPQKLKVMQRVRFRRRTTYDSGRTPEIGEAFDAPKLSAIDVAALRTEMQAFDAPPAEDESPKPNGGQLGLALREANARIAELEQELATARAAPPPVSEAVIFRLETAARTLHETGIVAVEAARDVIGALPARRPTDDKPVPMSRIPIVGVAVDDPRAEAAAKRREAKPATSQPAQIEGMPAGEAAVLIAVAQHRDGVTREQLSVLTGYKRSYRDLVVQKLSRAGFVQAQGLVLLATDNGRAMLPKGWKPLPKGARLREHWLSKLPEGERAILEVLVAAWPQWVTRDAIDTATGYKRSYRDLCIQKLRRRRLAVDAERGGVKASDELF